MRVPYLPLGGLNSYVEVLTPSTSDVAKFVDRILSEALMIK